jgi:hypothetical protein
MRNMIRLLGRAAPLALAGALCPLAALAQDVPPPASSETATVPLEDQFRDPPNSARPRVWWHWMNGNITKDGIAKDLAWMKRVGIGGMQNFDAALNTPRVVEKPLIYMTPEWKDAFRFTAQEADRLGLELAIAASPGWSVTGGPWVKPEDALKKLVWSETELAGGRRFRGKLATPPYATGPFQSIDKNSGIGSMLSAERGPEVPRFFSDVAVLAYPLPPAASLAAPVVKNGEGAVLDGAKLLDADLNTTLELGKPASGNPALVYEYARPQTVRSATVFLPGASALFFGSNLAPVLEASDDGQTWRKIADVVVHAVPTTIAFAPVTARHFRLKLAPNPSSPALSFLAPTPGIDLAGMGSMTGLAERMGSNRGIPIGQFVLSGEDRIDRFEAKAGFEVERDYYALSQGVTEAPGIDPAKVIDITARMTPEGILDWTPPKGRWRVVRMGTSLLGTMNHPAPPEATGLEVDKFDGAAVRRYAEHYIGMYRDAAGADMVGKRGVRALLIDSIEVGAANWTPRMIEQFKRLRGYDPTPWMPALTGVIVGSRGASDKFLFDYRRTLADLMASEHYGTMARVARENDLINYSEALESGRPSLGDDMAMRSHADIPMSAMWTHPREKGPQPSHVADIKGAASVANIYGRRFVAAESLTSGMSYWQDSPATLKRVIDLAFVSGLNRPVIHTSVHQPLDDKVPGFSLFIFGQYFNRHESWAELAKPWVDYLSRNALMLQQGRNVADVGYFYGEEGPLTGLYYDKLVADAPIANAYDFVNYDALTKALRTDGDELVTPGGARYRALYLGGSSRKMSLSALLRVAELAEAGATIVGMAPEGNPGQAGDAAEYAALVARLWPAGSDMTSVGKGRVIASRDIDGSLRRIGVPPQFDHAGSHGRADIPFVHRKLADGDSFFVVNRSNREQVIEARFRVTGKVPEIWRAETGKSEPASYLIKEGTTIVPLQLGIDESLHVVFRKPATVNSLAIKQLAPVSVGRVEGPWAVTFQPGRGAPASTTMASLAPLNESTDPGIKYFSGVATYTTSFTAPRGWKPGQPLWLSLGEAREIAEVRVNGLLAGHAWHAPYRVDISSVAKPGRNALEIKVANLWVNRLIGDRQEGAQKITWTALPTYLPTAPLKPSGLIGPVELLGQAGR